MLRSPERFTFTQIDNKLVTSLPYLPLTLRYEQMSLATQGLLDTGATVNVMPYRLGLQLGAIWEQQTTQVRLTGNLANFPARTLMVSATVGSFQAVQLVFAWSQSDSIPLILGQVNFFMEFDVCFFRSELAFEVKPKK